MSSHIRLLILSDTHGKWPYSNADPAPTVDVFLHCGDLTQVGGLRSFKRAMEDIKSIKADLKLVIAGNHDLELDEKWVHDNMDEDDLKDHRDCVSYMESLKEEGIYYLTEGTHRFTLPDDRQFSIHASPYTPEFGSYAFAYGKDEDRFNLGVNSVPNEVDILMTHGPPSFSGLAQYQLDVSQDGTHCGCEKLTNALKRALPRLHCFGHIHEGRGMARINWSAADDKGQRNPTSMQVLEGYGGAVEVTQEVKGTQTLLVNAALHRSSKGCLVDLGL